jgi:hypothetical protein
MPVKGRSRFFYLEKLSPQPHDSLPFHLPPKFSFLNKNFRMHFPNFLSSNIIFNCKKKIEQFAFQNFIQRQKGKFVRKKE